MSSGGRPETRRAILDAAQVVVERDGYHGASMEHVAREAGVSRQAVYLHFGSKLKLLLALVDQMNSSLRVGERLQQVAAACSGEEALERWIDLNADTARPILGVAVQLDAARRSDPEAQEVWRVPADDRRRWCLRITRRLANEGRLADGLSATAAADVLWAATMPALFEQLVVDRGWSTARYTEHVHRTMRLTLLCR